MDQRVKEILRRLRKQFPAARTALLHENPFQLLVATILSAQCTDERVNKVTPALFRKYPDPAAFATAESRELEQDIRSTGFFRMKAKNVISCCKAIAERHAGKVPADIQELVKLPGVGRKTANVVLGQAFGIASGVVVDTHVRRVARRLGLTDSDDPERIEEHLIKQLPPTSWIETGTLLILHGRAVCAARKPLCGTCILSDICPSSEAAGTTVKKAGKKD
jgi:endonuclease-3